MVTQYSDRRNWQTLAQARRKKEKKKVNLSCRVHCSHGEACASSLFRINYSKRVVQTILFEFHLCILSFELHSVCTARIAEEGWLCAKKKWSCLFFIISCIFSAVFLIKWKWKWAKNIENRIGFMNREWHRCDPLDLLSPDNQRL